MCIRDSVAGELAEPELEKLRGCGIDKLILVSGKGYDRDVYKRQFSMRLKLPLASAPSSTWCSSAPLSLSLIHI